ncbi:hypothetical protein ACEYYB_00090 [Paracoccus sp. p4-l81]|uniref:hypothetical protein n=1 Tax=unclassified Paracoccus (in: a-proteobacteria) TaxID=2688777 RepID=UPI0035B76729
MTALHQYQRLESPGLWRPAPDAQRREVVVMFRDATLVLVDPASERPLAHWSMPAMLRANPGRMPAIYAPGSGPDESLEIEDEIMVAAIDKLHRIIAARRPRPGRLRGLLAIAAAIAIAAGAVFWLPGALVRHAALVAPEAKRVEIGRAVLAEVETLTGPACRHPAGEQALSRLSRRLLDRPVRIAILPTAVQGTRALPGGIIIASHDLIAGHPGPEALAGGVLSADLAARADTGGHDPLLDVLHWAGMRAAFRLLTTGNLPEDALRGYGTALLNADPAPADRPALLAAMKDRGVPSTPFATSLDPVDAALAEGDPFKGTMPDPVLSDAEWSALAAICD